MTRIQGTYSDGRIVLDSPADWPNGSRVVVEPLQQGQPASEAAENWSDTPEAIEEWIQWYDSLEPLVLAPEDEIAWQEAQIAQKEHETATFESRSKKLEKLFP